MNNYENFGQRLSCWALPWHPQNLYSSWIKKKKIESSMPMTSLPYLFNFVFLCVAVVAVTVPLQTSPSRHINLENGHYSKSDRFALSRNPGILWVAPWESRLSGSSATTGIPGVVSTNKQTNKQTNNHSQGKLCQEITSFVCLWLWFVLQLR